MTDTNTNTLKPCSKKPAPLTEEQLRTIRMMQFFGMLGDSQL